MTDGGAPERERAPRPLDDVRRWIPAPALLTVVALAQLLLSEQGPLHRWKGGGFAMFASNEERVLQVHVARGDQCLSHRATWPEPLVLEQDRLASFPTEAGLRDFGEELGSGDWSFYFDAADSESLRVTPTWAAEQLGTHMEHPATFDSVQIDAWRMRFRPEGEDRNLNGRLDRGEDRIPNGTLDAPLVVPERIRRWSSVPESP
jgi:hypothetical protein